MVRKLMVQSSDGRSTLLEQAEADNEAQLQEELKRNPELLPLEELGIAAPGVVIGRESALDSGRIDLVLLGNGGDLALVEFKTGPQNPDFRACLAQLLDYGSDLWQMDVDSFVDRVMTPFLSTNDPRWSAERGADGVLEAAWGSDRDDPVGWRDRLSIQLRDGTFHYIVVAQRFTSPMLRTLQYLNATSRAARFSAVELVRFHGADHEAFEARVVAAAEQAPQKAAPQAKAALAGVDGLVADITDDDYRHALEDLFDAIAGIPDLTVFWGTSGCSLRVPMRGRSPLSVGWVFPPGPPRWMGLTDVTLGWYQDANGLALPLSATSALNTYLETVTAVPGGQPPTGQSIHGRTFPPAAFVNNRLALVEAIRDVATALAAT